MHCYTNNELADIHLDYGADSFSGTGRGVSIGSCIVPCFQPDVSQLIPCLHVCMIDWAKRDVPIQELSILMFREQCRHINWKKPYYPKSKTTRSEYSTYCNTCTCVSIQRLARFTSGRVASVPFATSTVSDRRWFPIPFDQCAIHRALVSVADGSQPFSTLWACCTSVLHLRSYVLIWFLLVIVFHTYMSIVRKHFCIILYIQIEKNNIFEDNMDKFGR